MRHIISFLLILMALAANGRQITSEEAQSIALEFINSDTHGNATIAPLQAISTHRPSEKQPDSRPYYIFNAADDAGFVIISGDTRTKKIIGYSNNGSIDTANMPPQLSWLLGEYEKQLSTLSSFAPTDDSWQKSESRSSNGVLLETANWGQDYPYNMYAQTIEGVKCPSGCVATAMAIVMKYHKFPEKGRGKHMYMSNGEKIEYDFDALQIDYSQLLDKYIEGEYNDEQAKAVGQLMKAAAAAVNMQYNPNGSGAMTCVVGHYLHENFHYSPNCQYLTKSNFTKSEWWEKIKNQIDHCLPIIYNGNGEPGGHAFVCDGYDADQNLHINWGWNGNSNGYFSLETMGGFADSQGMILNIEPSDDNTVYSRCWNDYGYLWATVGQNVGINISTDAIMPNVDFSSIAGMVTFPSDFEGNLTMALINENNDVVELPKFISGDIAGDHYEKNNDWDNLGYSWVGHGNIILRNIHFEGPINHNYRLAIVTKEENDDAWRIVLGTEEAPSSIPVTGNSPYVSHIKWNCHGDTQILESTDHAQNEQLLIGDSYSEIFKVSGGVAYMEIDGIYRTNGSDFSDFSMAFVAEKSDYAIDIFCNTYDKLLSRDYTVSLDTKLSQVIAESEKSLINSLKIRGELSYDNFGFILYDLPSLQHLDLSDATFEWNGNKLPYEAQYLEGKVNDLIGHTAPGLLSYKLPKNLVGFDRLSLGHRALEYLEIPKSVVEYDFSSISPYANAKLDLVMVGNPEPVSYEADVNTLSDFSNYRQHMTLIVPTGSRAKYLGHPNWQGFSEIIETDEPSNQRCVDKDGARYLLVHDFASLSGFYGSEPFGIIGEEIEVDGKRYPIKYVNSAANLTPTVYYESSASIKSNKIYEIVTPKLSFADAEMETYSSTFYVPGGFDKKESSLVTIEMWDYRFDNTTNSLEISSKFDDVQITEVAINDEIASSSNGSYQYNPNLPLDVKVSFTHRDQHSMVAHYTPEFNHRLMEMSGVEYIHVEPNDYVKIYNISGILVFKGRYSEAKLDKGIYIIVASDMTYKQLIK